MRFAVLDCRGFQRIEYQAQDGLAELHGVAPHGWHGANGDAEPNVARRGLRRREARHALQQRGDVDPIAHRLAVGDEILQLELLKPVVTALGDRAMLHLVEHADHSFRVAARTGRTAAEAETEALDTMANWMLARI